MEIAFGLILLAGVAVVTLVLPILGFVRSARLSREVESLRARLSALEEDLRLGRALHPSAPDPTGMAEPRPVPVEPSPVTIEPPPVAIETPAPAGHTEAAGPVSPVSAPIATEPAPAFEPALEPPPPPLQPSAGEPGTGRLEEAIGGRVLLYAGIVAFVLGIGFFVKYAFDQQWITEEMRVALGGICGAAFIWAGLRLARAGYETYGNILIGGGFAALYLSTYAAFDFYALIGRTAAATLFVAETVGAALLAHRQRHQGLAIMAVGGGFLTPFLVGGPADAQMTLFGYVALLVGGTAVLARRHDWPLLYLVSYALTILTLLAWAGVHYRPSKYLRTELFLTLYCAMFLVILRLMRRRASPLNDLTQIVLASAPVLYHFASIAILQRHDVALPVYLILFALTGITWSVRAALPWLRLTVWLAAIVPFLGWVDTHQGARWLVPSAATLGALFALPLVAQMDRVFRRDLTLGGADLVLLHLNALGTFFSAWVVLENVAIAWVARIGLLLAILHAALARALHGRDSQAALHALAAMFALVAAAVGVELDGRWLTAAWAAEGAAIVWVGLRVNRDWLRFGGAVLLTVAAARWLALSAPETPADFRLLVNEPFLLGAWIIGLTYVLAWIHARDRTTHGFAVAGLLVAASMLTVALLTTQNASYWQVQGDTMADATFAEQLVLSLLWAFYAGILIAVGIRRAYPPIRHAGIVLIAFTVLKVFLVDLSGLQGIYRVLGLLLVGAVLLVVSFLYQRARAEARPRSEPGPDSVETP